MFIAAAWGGFVEGENGVKYQIDEEGYRYPVLLGVSAIPDIEFLGGIPIKYIKMPDLGTKVMVVGWSGATILWTDDVSLLEDLLKERVLLD